MGCGYAAWAMRFCFDDQRPGREKHFGFSEPREVLGAGDLSEVVDAVAAAEQRASGGHWVAGFVAYEAAPAFDPALVAHPAVNGLPLVWFGVFDERLDVSGSDPAGQYELSEWVPNVDRASYNESIATIHRYIAAGDTYQVNHTLRLRGRFRGDPMVAYRRLISAQSGGFGAYLDIGSHVVMSASPELFFRWETDALVTRPMKGTIRRGRWQEEDARQAELLSRSGKDRAENLMIVDLLRNDLGRVAEFGSVEVDDLFALERYETLWQMTSTIKATPRPDVGLVDVFRALFPSGSVTGAPKVRTTEIIRELEPDPRGVYCGTVGVLAPPGSDEPPAQFSVAIRTLVMDREAGTAEYGTGGGITWESEAGGEYEEAMLKAEVLTHVRPPFSLLETMHWSPAGVTRRSRHLARLSTSADFFSYPVDLKQVEKALDGVSGDTEQAVRLSLAADGEIGLECGPLPDSTGPVRLAVDTETVDPKDIFLYHKTTNRRLYQDSAARFPEADEVVLTNPDGNVTETTISNLAARFGTVWLTPPVTDGCLPGAYRSELVSQGKLREASISVERLLSADEVAVLNSLRGWRSASVMIPSPLRR